MVGSGKEAVRHLHVLLAGRQRLEREEQRIRQQRRTIENRGKVDSDSPPSEAEEGIPYGRTRAALSKAGVHEATVVLMYLGSTARFSKAG